MKQIDRDVPFYSNTPDDTHCFQASFRMVLKYFWPETEYSWEELEKITAKVEGLWTWPLAGLLWLKSQGFDVKNIEPFDYLRFINEGGKYLLDFFGEEVGDAQIQHSDVEQERRLAKGVVKNVTVVKAVPGINDIKNLLLDGYVVICNINAPAVNEQPGYSGHFVVVKGFDDEQLILHDPGLPPLENRQVKNKIFESAWAYPDQNSKNIIAVRHLKR
jgi:hypothetical protein